MRQDGVLNSCYQTAFATIYSYVLVATDLTVRNSLRNFYIAPFPALILVDLDRKGISVLAARDELLRMMAQ